MGISSMGVGSGLDINSLVTQLVQMEKRQLNSLNSKKTTYNNQLSAFGRIKSDVDAFKTAVSKLKLDLDFAATKATSSNTTLLTASSSDTAVAGTYDIKVNTLAQAGIKASAVVTDSTADLGAALFGGGSDPATLTFTGNGKSVDVTVNSTDSLEELRDKINSAVVSGDSSAQSFAKASIIKVDTNQYKLVVAATEKGTTNDVTISSAGTPSLAAFLNTTTSQAAANATLTVNGIDITRSSNTITDVIDGVTLNLASADNTKTMTLTVARDTEAITKKVNDFISAYNKIADTVASLRQKGSTLEADSSANSVIYRLQEEFNKPANIAGNTTQWLSQIGISFSKEGKLSLDSTAFNKALETNFSSTISMFTDSTEGFAHRLSTVAGDMLISGGLVESRISGINTRIKYTDFSIDREQVRVEAIETRLRAQYSRLDSLLGTMKNSSSFLASL